MALFPTYNRFPLSIQKAEGTIVEDINGKTYLDFGSGIGVNNLGHRHAQVQKEIEKQLQHYWHVSNLYKQQIQEEVAKILTANSKGEYVFFCNSGAEANEAAIKLARKATGKETIITFDQSFHGRTFATMSATGQEKVRIGYGPMLPSFQYATFNDLDSVVSLAGPSTAAVMIELVQGEGGVYPAEEEFIKELALFCQEKGILLIVDEIQTGMGRTGTKFAYEHYGIEPDIFTLAKGLGNGLPVGAMIAKKAYGEVFGAGAHGSTFGGNPISMAAAKAVTSIIFDAAFLQELSSTITYITNALMDEIAPLANVKEIRGQGLMIGIEVHQPAGQYITTLMDKGLLVLSAGEKVIRLLPPLTVTKAEIDQAAALIKEVLSK